MARLNATRRNINNLLINGDFEFAPTFVAVTTSGQKWVDGTAAGSASNGAYHWGTTFGGSAAVSFDTAQAHSGLTSLKLSTTATGSFAEAPNVKNYNTGSDVTTGAIKVSPSVSYTFTWWMRTNYISGDSNNGAGMSVSGWTGTGGFNGARSGGVVAIKTTTGWTQYTLTFTSDVNDRYITVMPYVYGHTGTATLIMDAWYDDLIFGSTTPVTRLAA